MRGRALDPSEVGVRGAGAAARELSLRRALRRPGRLAQQAVLVLVSVLFLFPIYWMVATAVKPDAALFVNPPQWVPTQLVWKRFEEAFTYIPFLRYTWNTLYISLYNVVATVISCTLVAYGFSRLEWRGRDALFFVVIATMMLPYQVTLIPQYIIFSHLHWVGTFRPLTIPAWFGSAFFIFLMRQFFLSLPSDLFDSAKIDGAGHLRIIWHVLTPLSKPVLVTAAVFTFMWNWNDFFWPLIYLTSQDNYTLSLGLYNFIGAVARTDWGVLMAAASLMSIPPVVLFFFAQRYFVEGITLTGMKG